MRESGTARAASMVGAGIFLSRVAGFVRESVFAFFFGNSATADVWRVALRTPNVIQNLLGEGTLSASFIPVYSELLEEGREKDAGAFAGAALGILAVTAFSAALLGILLAPVIIAVFYPAWEPWQQALAVSLTRVLFVMAAVLTVSAWALGILNTHRRFFVSYVAPVLWNVAMIAVLITFGAWLRWGPERLVVALAWGALAGSAFQLGVQLPWVLPALGHFRLSLSRKVAGVQEALRNFLPVVAARGMVNLSGWLDTVLAALLATGAVAALGYAQTLYLLPISLFGMSIAASELPELSRRRGEGSEAAAARVRTGLGRLAFLIVPSTLAYLALGDLFIAALFERGEFDRADTALVYAVLAAYALGLFASASSRLLSSAFFALRDTRTPARIAYLRVGISLVVGTALMLPLDRLGVAGGEGGAAQGLRLGAAGLALGATVGAWTEYLLLRRSLARAIGPHGAPRRQLAVILAAGFAGTGAGLLAKAALGSAVPSRSGWVQALAGSASWLVAPLSAAGTALAFGVVYLTVAKALRTSLPPRTPTPG